MLCCLLSPICPTHLRKDKSFKPLLVGKLAEILTLVSFLLEQVKEFNVLGKLVSKLVFMLGHIAFILDISCM